MNGPNPHHDPETLLAPWNRQETMFARFMREEDGAVLAEYVTLLMGIFLSVSTTAAPLQNALMSFARDVFDHLHKA